MGLNCHQVMRRYQRADGISALRRRDKGSTSGRPVVGAGVALAAGPLLAAGAVLVAHVSMDRLAGYGLKYPTTFSDTHLGRIGR